MIISGVSVELPLVIPQDVATSHILSLSDLAKRGQLACTSIARSCFGNAYHADLHPDAPQTFLAPELPTGFTGTIRVCL